MRAFTFKVLITAFSYIVLHCCVILFLPGPLPSAYWVREMIVIKRYQADQITRPKILFVGGSSVLFGINAGMVQSELHMPAFNFGLHAGMRLEWILSEADRAAKPGDLLVMALEPNFYECGQNTWTQWQLYSALAWNLYLPNSLPDKFYAAFRGGSLASPFAKIHAYWDLKMVPARSAPRLFAMAPAPDVIARYQSDKFRTDRFRYSAYNTDEYGDMKNIAGSKYNGEAEDVRRPNALCAYSRNLLQPFVAKLQSRGIRVVFEYFPYLVDGKPQPDWTAAEKRFDAEIKELGSQIIGARKRFFFPRLYFFNTVHHLNETGRTMATKVIIDDLRKLGLATN